MKPRSEWKQPKRTPLRPGTKPIARESEKAKARRIANMRISATADVARRKWPKTSNAARQKREFARAFGSRARVRFVKSLGCIYCTALHPLFGVVTAGKCDNAHTEGGGMGRKGHYTSIVPLCREHHKRYDQRLAPLDDPKVRAAIECAAPHVETSWLAHLEATGG